MKTEITSKISKLKAKIRRADGKRVTYWKVTTPKPGGGRNRRFFKTETDADTFIEQQSIQLANHGTAGASMGERLRADAISANEILSPLGLSIVDAAKHYAKFIKAQTGGTPLAKAVEMLSKDRETGDYSATYRKNLAHFLKHFVEAFPGKTTTSITKEEIRTFLRERCKALESRKSYRRAIKTLFSYLIKNHNLTADPVPDLEKSKGTNETKYSVEILTPEACSRLLHAADELTLPSLAIGMFCGLRASEIERLSWSKVNLSEGIIIIDATVALKTGSRRVVPIPEACKQWLTPYAKTEGAVHPDGFLELFDPVRIAAGFRPSNARLHLRLAEQRKKEKAPPLKAWPSNCLRHSAISYAMADCGDQHKVSTWAGNSPKMIKQHYDAQATPSAAKAFYGILPTNPGNVRAFRAKAA